MPKQFADLHVHSSYSIGTEPVAEMVAFAERLGLARIAVLNHVVDTDKIEDLRQDLKKIKPGIEVLVGAEVYAENPDELRRKINALREKVDILAVHGGLLTINRAAVEDPRVDILTHPEYNRKDSGLDIVMAKLAAKNQVAIELNFREFLNSYRKVRSHILNHMAFNVTLAQKYRAPIIIASGAESTWDMRAGRELASLGVLAGMKLADAISAVSDVPDAMIEHSKKVRSKNFVMPGVEAKGEVEK